MMDLLMLSALIIRLVQLRAEYGDLPVLDYDGEHGPTPLSMEGVYVSKEGYVEHGTRNVVWGNCVVISLHKNE